jgi:ankyrin repeat protein
MEKLFKAAWQGDEGLVSRLLGTDPELLETTNNRGDLPLTAAAQHGQLGVVKLLVQRGANVNALGRLLRTALHQAANNGHGEMAAFLLQHGAQVSSMDANDRTPLSLACRKGHLGVVRLLQQHLGAHNLLQRLEDRDGWGMTALHHAAKKGHEEVVAFLLEQGADASSRSTQRNTALSLAYKHGRLGVVSLLLRHMGQAGLEARGRDGGTVLHWAASKGHEEMLAWLLSQGAQADTTDSDGITPLMYAAKGGHVGVVRMLLKHMEGQGVELTDVKGRTALHHAATRGKGNVARFLLLCGADPSLTDKEGRTPRAVAERACEDVDFYTELEEEDWHAEAEVGANYEEEDDEQVVAERVERARQGAIATFTTALEVRSGRFAVWWRMDCNKPQPPKRRSHVVTLTCSSNNKAHAPSLSAYCGVAVVDG